MIKLLSAVSMALIFQISCTDNAIDSPLQSVNEPIHISGALNTTFESSQTTMAQQSDQNTENVYFSIQGSTDKNNFWQRMSIKFDLTVESAHLFRPGVIFEISEGSAANKINYQSSWDESTYTDIAFEIDGGELQVDSIDDGNLAGRFKIWAHQSSGRRMTHGQVEDINLSNQGEISISGKFSAISK